MEEATEPGASANENVNQPLGENHQIIPQNERVQSSNDEENYHHPKPATEAMNEEEGKSDDNSEDEENYHRPKPNQDENHDENGESEGEEKKTPLTRTTFSNQQKAWLEGRFMQQYFLSNEERKEIAEAINVTEQQVMIWFQNRR